MTRSENGSSPSDPEIAGLDALDGERGPARPLSAHEAALVADRVMLQLESTRERAPSGRARLAFGRRRRPRWLLAAAGVTLATAAAALYVADWSPPNREAASGERQPLPTQHPNTPIDPGGRPTGAPRNTLDGGDERGPRTLPHDSRPAADHLARANALRGKHQYREALDLYLYVVSEYPDSMQSRTARLAAAAIRLEQLKDIDGAEELYRAVRTTSDGELAAQAAFGLAEIARARSDRPAEARALREFLAQHSGHPLAAAARRRLGALESP